MVSRASEDLGYGGELHVSVTVEADGVFHSVDFEGVIHRDHHLVFGFLPVGGDHDAVGAHRGVGAGNHRALVFDAGFRLFVPSEDGVGGELSVLVGVVGEADFQIARRLKHVRVFAEGFGRFGRDDVLHDFSFVSICC